jgi:hypothetical protein
MQKANYLFLLFAVFFSLLILFISLQSANQSRMINNTNLVAGKFYVAREVLPDHSFYPLLMATDRLRLELADSEKRIYLMVAYGNRRLYYTHELLNKGNQGLAFTTLSKSSKYLNEALEQTAVLLGETSLSKRQDYQALAFFVLENLDEHLNFILEHRDQFGNEEKVILEKLNSENSSSAEKLHRLMDQANQNF